MKKLTVNQIFELYKNMDFKEKILFDRKYQRIKESEKLELYEKRLNMLQHLETLTNNDGSPCFSLEWVKKSILNIN